MREPPLRLALASFLAVMGHTYAFADDKTIILQSTTSTQNSGLFDFILPQFKNQTGITVKVVAVGTGQALKNGRNGDGDVLLVHAKTAENKFVNLGHGAERLDVMYNDFIIIGPTSDPAGLKATTGVLNAFKTLANSKSSFVSRGDDSGTNKKELNLWKKAGINISKLSGDWYREIGSGMGATLNVAAGMDAYTITDRATWLAFKNKKTLQILSSGDPLLVNQYGIILVNPIKHPHVKAKFGRTFIKWLTGKNGQKAIAAFKLQGEQAFFPNAK